MCAMSYLPFPAVVSLGLLKDVIPVWMMGAIWGALFPFYLISMLALLMVRLHVIVRDESPFKLKPITQIVILIVYIIVMIFVMELMAFKLNFSQDSIEQVIRTDYPQYFYITQIYGVLIFSDPSSLETLMYTIFVVVTILIFAYSLVRYAIYHEIKMQVNQMSSQQKKYHEKIAKDSAVQVLAKASCFVSYGVWVTLTSLMDRNFNTIPLTSLFHTMLVGSPIPGTVIMFIQNQSYFDRIKQLMGFNPVHNSVLPSVMSTSGAIR